MAYQDTSYRGAIAAIGAVLLLNPGAHASPTSPASDLQPAAPYSEQILMTEVQLRPGGSIETARDARAVIAGMDLSRADALGDIEKKLQHAGVAAKVYTFAMSMESAAVLNGDVEPIIVDREQAATSKIIVSKSPEIN